MSKIDSVKIRMYNTGSVGDCFLLLFQKQEVTSFSMLIDCGGFKTKKDLITECVKDIKSSIVDDTIDLVVVTHEHEDHVSGFNQAREIFDDITFKQVWMSWAENDADRLAKKLFKEKGKRIKALHAVIDKNFQQIQQRLKSEVRQRGLDRSLRLRMANFKDALETLAFEDIQSLTSPGVRYKVSDGIKYVKGKSKSKTKMYKKPGDVIKDLKGCEGVKFYMLGPPYDEDLHGIKNDMQHDEMYSITKRLGLLLNNFHFNAFESSADKDVQLISPFASKYQMDSTERAKFNKDFYDDNKNKWRQIEYDWLDAAGELAIALTEFVNNTSLAMAIELEDSGQVLMFPADAQSGNWISWHDEKVSKALTKNGGKDVKTLLNNTVFYKVGHHGSHNGTASVSGLEHMTDGKFVAFMPLVQDKVPSQWGGSKNFPAIPLYEKLIDKTNGAVIRTDMGVITDKGAPELRKRQLSAKQIEALKKASDNPLYHEWIVKT